MSEEQMRDQTHERWRETLELLGISPESEARGEATAPAAQKAKAEPEPPQHFGSANQAQTCGPWERETTPDFEQAALPDVEESMRAVESEPAEEEVSEFRDEQQSRGTRHGRRGERSRPQRDTDDTVDRTPEGMPTQADSEAELLEEAEPEGRRHGIEETTEPRLHEFEEEDDEDEQEVEASTEEKIEEDRDEEPDTLSDWNVPSWQELISSLYRPER